MSLTRHLDEVQKPRIAAYDLEWWPNTCILRLAGFFDGTRFRAWTSMADMMEAILVPEYADWLFFAHAGGSHDILFMLRFLVDHPEY